MSGDTTVVGIDLSHVPDSGEDDPMSAALLTLSEAAVWVITSPADRILLDSNLGALGVLATAAGCDRTARLATALTEFLTQLEHIIDPETSPEVDRLRLNRKDGPR
jgi:hypothetical protein